MSKEKPPKNYEEALSKFVAEEEQRRVVFERSLLEKRKASDGCSDEEAKMSKAKIEAEIARKKMVIEEAFQEKVRHMWKQYEEKVSAMKEQTEADIGEMVRNKTAQLAKKIDSLKELYAAKSELRKQTLEKDVQMARQVMACATAGPLSDSLEDRRAFLKKELVEFKRFGPTKVIADEDALRRLSVSITKQSLCSSKEYIIYRGSCDQSECLVKIVVLSDRCSSYRSSIRECSKVARWLMSGGELGEPRHPSFVKLYHFFLSDNKTYAFMQALSTTHLEDRAKQGAITTDQVRQTLAQLFEGVLFMHTRAIAHLNLRGESVLIDQHQQQAKLVGLCYAKIYFNPDTETFFKLPKLDYKRVFLPLEVFADEFDPPSADLYSFGYLLYATLSDLKKKHRSQSRLGHLEYDNLESDPAAKAFVQATTTRDPEKRLKLNQVKSQSYFTQK